MGSVISLAAESIISGCPSGSTARKSSTTGTGSRRLVDLPAIAISFGSINMHEIEFQKKRDVPRIESVSRIDGQVPAVRST